MNTIVGTEGRAGNDYLVPIAVALVTTLLLKAGMIAIFSAAGLLLLNAPGHMASRGLAVGLAPGVKYHRQAGGLTC